MKKNIALLFVVSTLLSACVQQPPVVVERHHYYRAPESKASANVSAVSAEGFRAVEAPGSYSQ